MLLLKNPQFLPNLYETWSKLPPGEGSILTESHTNWAKIVDFSIKAHFSMCPIFFGPDFKTLGAGHDQEDMSFQCRF